MKYVSTRGQAPVLDFDDALLCGLARDGGLYVPEKWPEFSKNKINALRGLSYTDTALQIMWPFMKGVISERDLSEIINNSYANFNVTSIAPLKQLSKDVWLMELFHGPTLAFKDFAMQFLGRMFDYVLKKRGERITIIGATSGDTGSAAIEACRGRQAIQIFILHPKDRVSDVQRRQMTTVNDPNVHNIAVKGSFDDCQNLVKAMFNDIAFRDYCKLSAVNSINWVRVMAQIVYYFYGACLLGAPKEQVSFSVPTGNFGNIFAGYGAKRMGLQIEQLIIGSNRNDILTRFLKSGHMRMRGVYPTISPSMDIQISSNFERLLFELYDRDESVVRTLMKSFKEKGEFHVGKKQWSEATDLFSAQRYSDDETCSIIRKISRENGELLDPHSAIGLASGMELRNSNTKLITLATAHPAKFPNAVKKASGILPSLPERLSNLHKKEEHYNILDNDLVQVQEFVKSHQKK